MSHIVEFKIEGLAGRKEPVSKVMDRHVNIFFGLNGCGKTSLLKILNSAMSNNASTLARVPFTSASVSIYSVNWSRVFTRTITKPDIARRSPKVEEATEVRIDESGAIVLAQRERMLLKWKTTPIVEGSGTASWHHQYLPTSRLLLAGTEAHRFAKEWEPLTAQIAEDRIDMFFADSLKRLWIQYTSLLLSRIRKAQDAGLASILREVVATTSRRRLAYGIPLDADQAYERMKKFVTRQGSPQLLARKAQFKKRYEADVTLRRVVMDIDGIEKEIEEAEAPRASLQQMISELFAGGKTLSLTDNAIEIKTSSGIEIGAASLSSGEKHLLLLLVETLLAGDSSIIIDEPEISMHVDWQKRLVDIMRLLSPKAQIIIATHSPEIMATIDDELIARL